MKNLVIIIIILASLTSCSSLKKPQAEKKREKPESSVQSKNQNQDPAFINSITIKPGDRSGRRNREPVLADETGPVSPPISPEILYPQQFKYAILLDIPVEQMMDHRLIDFLENWYGTRYQLGGSDKSGIDCSAFVQVFMTTLYGLSLPRTSRDQYNNCMKISKEDLREGDLVFFRTTRRRQVSHVGIYLMNGKFVHASTSSGVMISDLSDAYFSRNYLGAGRVQSAVSISHTSSQ